MKNLVKNNLLTTFLIFCFFIIVSSIVSAIYYNIKYQMLKIGFPFVYYLEFQLSGNEFKNFSWFPSNATINILFYGILSLAITVFYMKKKNGKQTR